ncbi:MAG: HIT family protein [Phycisphaeraceae bacterium]
MLNHPTDSTCIFCEIIAGRIPCHKLHEDERVLAFLDVGPLSEGHALVIPKGHYPTLNAVPAEDAAAIGRVLPGLSKAIMQATDTTSWNVLQNNGEDAGQAVHHVHFHIIPRSAGDARETSTPGHGLPFGWPAGEIDRAAAASLAEQIQTHLGR